MFLLMFQRKRESDHLKSSQTNIIACKTNVWYNVVMLNGVGERLERESFRSRCAQRSVENGSGDFEDRRKDVRGFAAIGLDNPKFDANFGGVMRAAGCYGAAMVAISGGRMRHVATDTGKMWRSVPVIETEDLHSVIPFDCVTVAVDLIPGARSLVGYAHP